MEAGDEVVAVVDGENRVVGSTSRREMRARRLAHRATYVLVFNSAGDLFVQRRTASKDVFPGYYDVAAGGVVLAGESYDECAARELEEELGIRNEVLTPLFDLFYGDEQTRVWGRAYQCVYDGGVVLQPEEVESGTFRSVEEVLLLAAREPFTPDGLVVLQRYLRECDR